MEITLLRNTENRDNPEGWGSELCFESTQQHGTAKASGSAWGGATRFPGSWQPPARSMGQRGPPVLVPSCSLPLGATPCSDTACPLTVAILDPEGLWNRERRPMLLLLESSTAERHQLETPENSRHQNKTVFCFPSGFLWERKLMLEVF